ncbi:MAG: hypothetical protein J7501_07560 [Bdellovibrio sp.]|nr:hypothetical protein [Bdellovibrio sp.]
MIQNLVLISFLSLSSTLAFAGDIQAAFETLKNSGVNYDPDGAVCEELERVRLDKIYPADKFVITGDVEYSTGGLTIGELDIIILDRQTNKVVLLEEVKCWKDFDGALLKAKSQKQRFEWNLEKSPRSLIFTSYDGRSYSAEQFMGNIPFNFISQQGGVAKGFTYEFDLNLREVHQLRMMLLKCQQNGECAKPH